MADVQAWRDLRDGFRRIIEADKQQTRMGATFYGADNGQHGGRVGVRGWLLEDCSDDAETEFKYLARRGAVNLLRVPANGDGSEWVEWLNAIRAQSLIRKPASRWIDLEGNKSPAWMDLSGVWCIENVCDASAEFCEVVAERGGEVGPTVDWRTIEWRAAGYSVGPGAEDQAQVEAVEVGNADTVEPPPATRVRELYNLFAEKYYDETDQRLTMEIFLPMVRKPNGEPYSRQSRNELSEILQGDDTRSVMCRQILKFLKNRVGDV